VLRLLVGLWALPGPRVLVPVGVLLRIRGARPVLVGLPVGESSEDCEPDERQRSGNAGDCSILPSRQTGTATGSRGRRQRSDAEEGRGLVELRGGRRNRGRRVAFQELRRLPPEDPGGNNWGRLRADPLVPRGRILAARP